jgi:translation elongation factor EF-G
MFVVVLPIIGLALGAAYTLNALKEYRQFKTSLDKDVEENLEKSKELSQRILNMDTKIKACNAECDETDALFKEAMSDELSEEVLDALAERFGKPRRKVRKLRVVE